MTARTFFQRRSMYYNFNFLLPCLLLTLLSIVGFHVPCDSEEKIVLQITNLLAIDSFKKYLASILPYSSLGVPVIGLFFNQVSIFCTLSLIGNLYVLHLNQTDIEMNEKMNKWVENCWPLFYSIFWLLHGGIGKEIHDTELFFKKIWDKT